MDQDSASLTSTWRFPCCWTILRAKMLKLQPLSHLQATVIPKLKVESLCPLLATEGHDN